VLALRALVERLADVRARVARWELRRRLDFLLGNQT
jgi:hypothetical protein